MPLRDHFHRPDGRPPNWDRLHGGWPMVIAQHLKRILPPGFNVAPQIHVGAFEVDIGVLDKDDPNAGMTSDGTGGTSVRVWAPPTLSLDTDPPDVDEYAVRVYDDAEGERLVASVEFVSPRNKDRPDSRRAFVAKCAALLQQDVCVAIVDIVPVWRFNLYAELLELIGGTDPLMSDNPPTYAVILRGRRGSRRRIETFAHVLHVGQPLPTLPLWLSTDQWVSVELEPTYEETCRLLGVP